MFDRITGRSDICMVVEISQEYRTWMVLETLSILTMEMMNNELCAKKNVNKKYNIDSRGDN